MVHTPDQWTWSSYRATARLCEPPSWLTIDWLLATFSELHSRGLRLYTDFVADERNQPGPWEKLKNQIFLGPDEFVASLPRTLDPDASHQEIPAIQRRPPPRPLTQIAEAYERDEAIFDAYTSGGYSLKDIGNHFRLHYSRVSRIMKQQRVARNKT